jgi:hypothetical protein
MLEEDDEKSALMVLCRAKSGAVADLQVLDISPGGCMVASAGWMADLGERVLTTVRGIGVQTSHLVWMEDGRAGIAFEQPLHAAVYDYLLARLEGYVESEREAAARAEAEQAERRMAGPRRKLY